MFKTPILLIVFNRPEKTKLVLEQIKQVKPAFLYVAADGPRPNIDEDKRNCTAVRNMIEAIDWDCQIKTLFQDRNLGCKEGVSTAINWFFEQVAAGIILEDDIIPDKSFFFFCEELLEKYREDNRVMLINGSNFNYKGTSHHHSYYFSRYPLIWGWATWRRAWQHYDIKMTSWPERKKNHWLDRFFDQDRELSAFWSKNFNKVYRGKINTWDYQWVFSVWTQNGLSIHPHKNLIRNIGFGKDATHTTHEDGAFSDLKIEIDMHFPLSHPPLVVRDAQVDDYLEDVAYARRKKRNKIPWHQKLKREFKRIFGKC